MSTDEPTADDKVPESTPTADDGDAEEAEDSPWALVVIGILLMISGVWIYWYFGKLEREGGSVSMPALGWMIYDFLGRTGLLVLLELGGIGMVWGGVSGLRNRSADDE